MADQIFETVVTTCSAAGAVHVAPMGARYVGDEVVLMPFKPSTTLDNIVGTGVAVLNLLTDVRVFAGCVTGRREWSTVPAGEVDGARAVRLACALGHAVLRLVEQREDAQRPVLRLARVHEAQHAPFRGFNRAQAAVIEGAVLISRLHMLPAEKIDGEMRYLQIAIDKTAGPAELEAWEWLQQAVARHRAAQARVAG
ncbi:DUF447 domain-containing protein [Piscinibacter sp. XHJ-5]|uniref:DUF447 domain-containing protein n=1 Tax=Piscinibacter sp. XHJ-5 TaxID=3037797 RepID=UPI00245302F0|nr:DUF447 domain-containing protein [Piscinibacter sp. XHJ-5]